VQYTVTDGLDEDEGLLDLTVYNQKPKVEQEYYRFVAGSGSYSVGLPSSDADGDPVSGTTSVTYDAPSSDWVGEVQLPYSLSDPYGAAVSGSITIEVVAQAPDPEPIVAVDDLMRWAGGGQKLIGSPPLSNDFTIYPPLQFRRVVQPSGSFGELEFQDGNFIYTPYGRERFPHRRGSSHGSACDILPRKRPD
jgi:hypothetical protein